MQVCPGCNTKNRESARYCDQCGQRLVEAAAPRAGSYTPRHLAERILQNRGAMQGERKQVTVLFADIKGSTRLAEKAGAETWHHLLNEFFALLSAAVHRYEGTVNQYTGDGIMALFGAPIAHEDHAQRAALAALEMQREVRRYAAGVREEHGLELAMRVGLNTGEVVVGTIGDDLRMDYTAKGLTVNLAARMEQLCESGCISLSRYTAALIEDGFELRDLGEQQVHGSSHPIRMYQLRGQRGDAAGHERRYAVDAPALHGRHEELAALRAALERVCGGGGGRIVALTGEAGIGKTRLCHEFMQHCAALGVPVHRAAGVAYSSALPLLPVRILLRSRLGIGEQDGSEQVRARIAQAFPSTSRHRSTVAPAVAEFLGSSGDASQAGGHRSLMLERIARYLPRTGTPQVLLIEDLHYTDPATEDFLTRLCEYIADSRTLLLLNYRSDYAGRWFVPYLDEQVVLKALPAEDVERMALALLGPARNLAPVARRIAQRAGGNPFFVEEAVQALVEAGHLWGSTGNYAQTRAIDEWPIPQSVQALVAGRVDRLPPSQKTLLQTAAVLGRSFDSALLRVCLDSLSFEKDLAALCEAGFLHRPDAARSEFCHALTQEVAYHAQLEEQRAQTHAAVAAALESLQTADAEPGEGALAIAHHWAEAGHWERAGAWNLQAARWCAPRDIAATLAQFRSAISHLDRADYSFETMRMRIAARAGLIRMAQFTPIERSEVETAYHDAWRMTEEFSDMEAGAELLFSYGAELQHRGEAEKAAQLTAQAVGDAQAAAGTALIRRFRFLVLMTHNAAGRLAQGLELANSAGDDWLRQPVGEENFMSRGFYGALRLWQGNLAEARAHLEASVEYAACANREAIWQHADLVDWAWFSGEHAQALEHAERALRLAQAYGSPFLQALALRALGLAQVLAGQHAAAVAPLEQGRALVAAGGFAHSQESQYLAVLAAAYQGAGRRADALRTAEQAITSSQAAQARIFELHAWSTYLLIGGARADEGLARMQELMEFTGAEGFRPWWWLARAAQAPEAAQAEQCRDRAIEEFRRIGASAHAQRLVATAG